MKSLLFGCILATLIPASSSAVFALPSSPSHRTTPAAAAPTASGSLFAATGGSFVIEFDPDICTRYGFSTASNDGRKPDWHWIGNIAPNQTNFTVRVVRNQPQEMSQMLQSAGGNALKIATGADNWPARAEGIAVLFAADGIHVRERQNYDIELFTAGHSGLSAGFDEKKNLLTLSVPLKISEVFAREVLKLPSAAGHVAGLLTAYVTLTPRSGPVEPTAQPAPGGGSQRTSSGVDIIVSYVGIEGSAQINEYGSIGGFGGIAAYAVATTSCNLGDIGADWYNCQQPPATCDIPTICNQHPVIAQNMYRLMNGRFEMIGLSWVKHGFCGADAGGPNCTTCHPDTTCDSLGWGCTDTYSASLNSDQPSLGPRSEVNPWTGCFPYPYILHYANNGNAIFKRLQVHNNDLDPSLNSGAQYLYEVQYIHPDEPDVNRFNNCSYRPVVVGALTGNPSHYYFDLSFSGTANPVPQMCAIEAWPGLDPGAAVTDVFVPGEGRFILGYHVTSVDANTWHYEYAIYNQNSDRSASSFSVPVSCGTAIANIGFHDVDYHTDEPYDLTDWDQPAIGTAAGPALTWSTHPYPSDPANANALRWSTLYSFRFDANTPPTSGAITIGLFKAGSPSSITTTIPAVPSAPAQALPVIGALNSASAACGVSWQSAVPSVSGPPPMTWSFVGSPPVGMTINPTNGTVTWPSPVAAVSPYTVTIKATNPCGDDTKSYTLTVAAGDFDGDGLVTLVDLPLFINELLVNPSTQPCAADVNLDGNVDGLDIEAFVLQL